MVTSLRWTLDIARLVDDDIVRHHLTGLRAHQAQTIKVHEQVQPGEVFIEQTRHVPGDRDWTIVYRNPLATPAEAAA